MVAKSPDTPILIFGETGTGKELLASAIHYRSPNFKGTLITMNSAAIPKDLVETELFGYEKGAFTGAFHRRVGKVEQAYGGTIFLDEIGDMPFSIQAKVLRLLQEKTIERLGGRQTVPVDVRILAATHRDLRAALADGRFREDLYYRLKVVTIGLPPLRDRIEDIPALVDYFLSRFSHELRVENPGITKDALVLLSGYSWPGNVRELANIIQKSLIFSRVAPISQQEISQAIRGKGVGKGAISEKGDQVMREWIRELLISQREKHPFDSYMDHFARLLVGEALNLTGGNRSRAAKLLSISRPTLHSKIEKYGLKFETSVKDD